LVGRTRSFQTRPNQNICEVSVPVSRLAERLQDLVPKGGRHEDPMTVFELPEEALLSWPVKRVKG
jgi:hypothetical protein